MNDNLAQLGLSIVEKSGSSILTSIDSEGYPNAKAMLPPREHEGLREFYFTTNTASLRVQQYRTDARASIYFFDSLQFRGIMLKGEMQVLSDQPTRDRIWRQGDELYYPLGVTDPDYCVLKFTAKTCRLYEKFHSYDFEV